MPSRLTFDVPCTEPAASLDSVPGS